MSKVQVSAEVDLNAIFHQLETDELENYVIKIQAIIEERGSKNNENEIARLLLKLNAELVLSQEQLERFHYLRTQREEDKLSKKELKELFELIKEEEALRVDRVQLLAHLATLKDQSMEDLLEELGLNKVEHV